MKMKLVNLRILFLVCITGIILSSCKKDETTTTTEDAIIGTWTSGTPTVSVMVDSKTLVQFYIDDGYTAEEAQAAADFLTEVLKLTFTGTVQIKADKTYTSNMGGSSDSGTWSLNADRTKLTIVSGSEGTMVFDVAELTSSKLRLQISETGSEDINGDAILETLNIDIDITFSK